MSLDILNQHLSKMKTSSEQSKLSGSFAVYVKALGANEPELHAESLRFIDKVIKYYSPRLDEWFLNYSSQIEELCDSNFDPDEIDYWPLVYSYFSETIVSLDHLTPTDYDNYIVNSLINIFCFEIMYGIKLPQSLFYIYKETINE